VTPNYVRTFLTTSSPSPRTAGECSRHPRTGRTLKPPLWTLMLCAGRSRTGSYPQVRWRHSTFAARLDASARGDIPGCPGTDASRLLPGR
jgi:hypothetical protein